MELRWKKGNFPATAREKVESAGGTVSLLREPKATKSKTKQHGQDPAPAVEEE